MYDIEKHKKVTEKIILNNTLLDILEIKKELIHDIYILIFSISLCSFIYLFNIIDAITNYSFILFIVLIILFFLFMFIPLSFFNIFSRNKKLKKTTKILSQKHSFEKKDFSKLNKDKIIKQLKLLNIEFSNLKDSIVLSDFELIFSSNEKEDVEFVKPFYNEYKAKLKKGRENESLKGEIQALKQLEKNKFKNKNRNIDIY